MVLAKLKKKTEPEEVFILLLLFFCAIIPA